MARPQLAQRHLAEARLETGRDRPVPEQRRRLTTERLEVVDHGVEQLGDSVRRPAGALALDLDQQLGPQGVGVLDAAADGARQLARGGVDPAVHTDFASAPGRIRTCDTRFRKPTLYPLSYEGLTAPYLGKRWRTEEQRPSACPVRSEAPTELGGRGDVTVWWHLAATVVGLRRALWASGQAMAVEAQCTQVNGSMATARDRQRTWGTSPGSGGGAQY
jgi:hypothetical protein